MLLDAHVDASAGTGAAQWDHFFTLVLAERPESGCSRCLRGYSLQLVPTIRLPLVSLWGCWSNTCWRRHIPTPHPSLSALIIEGNAPPHLAQGVGALLSAVFSFLREFECNCESLKALRDFYWPCRAVTPVKVIISQNPSCQAPVKTFEPQASQLTFESAASHFPHPVLEKAKEGDRGEIQKAAAAAKKISGDAAVSSSFIRAGWHFHLSGRRENSAGGFSPGRWRGWWCTCRTATPRIGSRNSRRSVATWLNILSLVHFECFGRWFLHSPSRQDNKRQQLFSELPNNKSDLRNCPSGVSL